MQRTKSKLTDILDNKQRRISVEFNDTLNTFEGWKSIFENNGSWIQYNSVDFGKKLKSVQLNAKSENGGALEIHLDKADGQLVSEVTVPKSQEMKITEAKISKIKPGIHNLVVVQKSTNPVEVDWIQFSK